MLQTIYFEDDSTYKQKTVMITNGFLFMTKVVFFDCQN